MISQTIKKLLQNREFVHVATADLHAVPTVAPKYLIKFDQTYLYVADYVIGTTWENLNKNPQAAVSFMDYETLIGYLVKGPVTVLTEGVEFQTVIHELQEKQLSLTVERIIQGVQRAKKHRNFQVISPEKVAVFKIKVAEIIEINPTGKLNRETV